jgi:hypothetical protein
LNYVSAKNALIKISLLLPQNIALDSFECMAVRTVAVKASVTSQVDMLV